MPNHIDQAALAQQTILVPVDFSEHSRAALGFAAHLATRMGSRLLVLHVLHETGDNLGYYRRHDADNRLLPLEDVAEFMVGEFVQQVREEYPNLAALDYVSIQIVTGLPSGRILEVAAREYVDMIVMGTHGRSGLAHLLTGSVAEFVSRHSRVPVTTVRMPMALPQQGENQQNNAAAV